MQWQLKKRVARFGKHAHKNTHTHLHYSHLTRVRIYDALVRSSGGAFQDNFLHVLADNLETVLFVVVVANFHKEFVHVA